MEIIKLKFIRPFKAWLRLINLIYFGNTLGFRINFKWKIHQLICHLRYSGGAHLTLQAKDLRKNGFTYLGNSNVDDLANYLEEKFERHHRGTESDLPRSRDEFIAKEIHRVLCEHKNSIESFYGSFFQTHWVNFSKYTKAESEDKGSSFGWHIDDNPKQLMKVFIYFTDTYENNAAFRAFPYRKSIEIFKRGFISNSIELRTKSQKLITENDMYDLKIFEGQKGTVLMFDNNLIHKATTPREGYRIVAQIEIYPSAKELSYENILNSLDGKILRDYPENPFFNPYQTVQ